MIDDAFTPAENQRHRCFDFFADERSFPPCYARLTIPTHTECRDRFGGLCHPRDLECAHLLPKGALRNRIKGLRQNPRMKGHPLLTRDLDEILFDYRNSVPVCAQAHHQMDQSGIRPAWEDLPDHFYDYCDELWLTHWAMSLYPPSGEMELAA